MRLEIVFRGYLYLPSVLSTGIPVCTASVLKILIYLAITLERHHARIPKDGRQNKCKRYIYVFKWYTS